MASREFRRLTMRLVFIAIVLISLATGAVANQTPIIFFELIVKDLAKAEQFYGKVLGWKFQNAGPDFRVITNAGMEGGLLQATEGVVRGNNIKIFARVDNLLETSRVAQSLGGRIIIGPMTVSPTRTLMEISDTEGNLIGLIHDSDPASPSPSREHPSGAR
jgi:predicted enzyme related to lactoylglutathione lyase